MTDTGTLIDLGIPAAVKHPGRPPRRSTLVGLAAVAAVLAGAGGYAVLRGILPDPENSVPVPAASPVLADPVRPGAASVPPAGGGVAVPGRAARPGLMAVARRSRGSAVG